MTVACSFGFLLSAATLFHMAKDERKKLLIQKARLDARLQALDRKAVLQARRDDARRKIIAGALALEHAEIDPAFGAALFRVLNRYVRRPADRRLLGLPDRTVSPANDFAPVARPPAAESA